MSNYPPDNNYPPQEFPEDARQPGPPGGHFPPGPPPQPHYGSHYPPPPPSPDVSGRVVPPAVALIVVAVINLLGGLYFVGSSAYSSMLPDDQIEAQLEMYPPEWRDKIKQQGVKSLRTNILVGGVGGGGVISLCALLILVGGIRMIALKWYGLAIMASVLAALPCISCMGCCGIGEGVGVWALVVLLNPEVRAAFR